MEELLDRNLTPAQGDGEGGSAPQEAPAAENAAGQETEPREVPGAAAPAEEQQPRQEAAAPEEPKTVFAPLPWEKRAGGKEKPSREEKGRDQSRRQEEKAEREARLQEEKAEREAKLLEAKLEREHRKAQEQERRQEARDRREEERRRAREERAQQKTVRRVGTMTLGVALIAIGAAILAYMVNPSFNIQMVAYLAPVILISLGVEVLIRYFFSKDRTYKYDFASGLICIFLVMGSFAVAAVPYVMYYISPDRFAAENTLIREEEDKIYLAFQGDQRVRDYYVNGGVGTDGPYARRDENGDWLYQLDYFQLHVNLLSSCADEGEFTQTCRELLDKLQAQGVGENAHVYISFAAPENEEGMRYELDLDNRLQLEMDAQHLQELVNPIYSQPTLENGWYPAGYDQVASDFGDSYADQFAVLLENYGEDSASIYLGLLYNSGEGAAQEYYDYAVGEELETGSDASEEPEPPVPAPEEGLEESSAASSEAAPSLPAESEEVSAEAAAAR